MRYGSPYTGSLTKKCPCCGYQWAKLYYVPNKVYMTTCLGCDHHEAEDLSKESDALDVIEYFTLPKDMLHEA